MTTRPLKAFRDQASASLARGLRRLGVKDVGAALDALTVAPGGRGDFAFHCFGLAKELRKAPDAIAADLVGFVELPGPFERVEAAGPYVNFTLRADALAHAVLTAVLEEKALYGTERDNGLRVIVEHTSANPNGPFHVGRARNPIIGDTMARVLRSAGFDVETQYYVNDMGKQVAILVWALARYRPDELPPVERDKPDHDYVRYYQKASPLIDTDEAVNAEVQAMLSAYESGDDTVGERFRRSSQRVLDGMEASLARINVSVDHFVWESQFVEDGSARSVVEGLRKAPCVGEEDGAFFLDLKGYGIHGRDARFFFTRKDARIQSLRDLRGKTLVLQVLRSTSAFATSGCLAIVFVWMKYRSRGTLSRARRMNTCIWYMSAVSM